LHTVTNYRANTTAHHLQKFL